MGGFLSVTRLRLLAFAAVTTCCAAEANHLESGIQLFRERNFTAATEAFRSCANSEPANARCWYWLGEAALTSGQYNDAAAALQRAVNLEADFADAYRS